MKRTLVIIFFTLTLSGLLYLRAQTSYESFQPKANVVEAVMEGGSLWFATYGQGIMKYDLASNEWTVFSTANNNVDNDFYYCLAVSPDYIWAGTSDGLYIYDRKREFWKKRKFSAGGEYGNWIRALYYDADSDMLWIGRFAFLSRLNVKKQKYEDFDMTFRKDDRTNNFKCIKPDGDKHIWFGTEGGVYLYDKSKDIEDKTSLVFFNKTNGFRGEGDYPSIAEILCDQQSVWFGTEEFITNEKPRFNTGGLFRFNRRASWQKYDVRTGLPANGIKAILKTGKRLWVSVYEFQKDSKTEIGKGLVMMDINSGKVMKIDLDEIKINTLTINTLSFDGRYLWLGTDSGIWRIQFTNPFAQWNLKK